MTDLLLVAAAALIDRDGSILLARRKATDANGGQWEFPGGKLEKGETPEAALVRELNEELGIETHASCLAPIGFASEPLADRHLLMPLFVCRKWSGTPQAKDHDALVWVRKNELMRYELTPPDRPLAAQLRDIL